MQRLDGGISVCQSPLFGIKRDAPCARLALFNARVFARQLTNTFG
jgi:hypothetical protein